MHDPKSILFSTELKWPPFEEFGVSKDVVRALYNKMFEPGGYTYDNLELQRERPLLHRKSAKGKSICQFGVDSITIEESDTDSCELASFLDVVKTVLGGLEQDDIPPFLLQRVRIQCLCQPTHCDSVELLAGRASRAFDTIEPFQRPPALFGMRFRFPPVHLVREPDDSEHDGSDGGEENESDDDLERAIAEGRVEEKAGFVVLRFESYAKDSRLVWMEIASTYPLPDPLMLADIDGITKNIRTSYEFLTVNSRQFLEQFDTEDGGDNEHGD